MKIKDYLTFPHPLMVFFFFCRSTVKLKRERSFNCKQTVESRQTESLLEGAEKRNFMRNVMKFDEITNTRINGCILSENNSFQTGKTAKTFINLITKIIQDPRKMKITEKKREFEKQSD